MQYQARQKALGHRDDECSASTRGFNCPHRSKIAPRGVAREIEDQFNNPAPGEDFTVIKQLRQSYDEGVAEFLDLERVKPNTLGNSRLLLVL